MSGAEGPDYTKGQSGIVRAALLGLCPRCGDKTLFEAPARVALTCSNCGLDLGAHERGGRFAGLLTALVAVLLIILAYAVEATLRPPLWLQAAFWAPVTVGVVIFVLRFFKALLLYASYERAEEKSE